VRGTEREQLKKGPGLYENSPLPGIADEANVPLPATVPPTVPGFAMPISWSRETYSTYSGL